MTTYTAMSPTPDEFQAADHEMCSTEPNFATEQLATIAATTAVSEQTRVVGSRSARSACLPSIIYALGQETQISCRG